MHSEYSVTDGIVRIDEAVAKAKADGMPALALTDAGNVFGMVKFYTRARRPAQAGIGVDCWIQNEPTATSRTALLLSLCAPRYLRLSSCCRAPG
jgi:DNA polymerase-3 subunit alpha